MDFYQSNTDNDSGLNTGRNHRNRGIDTIDEVTEENGSSAQVQPGSGLMSRRDAEMANAAMASDYVKSPRT